MNPSPRRPGRHAWLSAARPRTLPAAAAPVIMGTAMAAASGGFHAASAACALLGALLIQVAANYANDYYDFIKGADAGRQLGPVRATQAGWVTPAQMRNAVFIVMAAAIAPGLYLVWRGGWPILLIGVLSLTFALLYTGGPLPLGYIGAADLFVLVFFGPVAVAGTWYAQTGRFDMTPVIAGIAPGLISMAVLTVNNLRDIDEDRRAGKRTLAVRLGATFARFEYGAALQAATLVIPPAACWHAGSRWLSLAAMAAALPAMLLMRALYAARDGPGYNRCLALTGQLLLLFALLFSAGWMIA